MADDLPNVREISGEEIERRVKEINVELAGMDRARRQAREELDAQERALRDERHGLHAELERRRPPPKPFTPERREWTQRRADIRDRIGRLGLELRDARIDLTTRRARHSMLVSSGQQSVAREFEPRIIEIEARVAELEAEEARSKKLLEEHLAAEPS